MSKWHERFAIGFMVIFMFGAALWSLKDFLQYEYYPVFVQPLATEAPGTFLIVLTAFVSGVIAFGIGVLYWTSKMDKMPKDSDN